MKIFVSVVFALSLWSPVASEALAAPPLQDLSYLAGGTLMDSQDDELCSLFSSDAWSREGPGPAWREGEIEFPEWQLRRDMHNAGEGGQLFNQPFESVQYDGPIGLVDVYQAVFDADNDGDEELLILRHSDDVVESTSYAGLKSRYAGQAVYVFTGHPSAERISARFNSYADRNIETYTNGWLEGDAVGPFVLGSLERKLEWWRFNPWPWLAELHDWVPQEHLANLRNEGPKFVVPFRYQGQSYFFFRYLWDRPRVVRYYTGTDRSDREEHEFTLHGPFSGVIRVSGQGYTPYQTAELVCAYGVKSGVDAGEVVEVGGGGADAIAELSWSINGRDLVESRDDRLCRIVDRWNFDIRNPEPLFGIEDISYPLREIAPDSPVIATPFRYIDADNDGHFERTVGRRAYDFGPNDELEQRFTVEITESGTEPVWVRRVRETLTQRGVVSPDTPLTFPLWILDSLSYEGAVASEIGRLSDVLSEMSGETVSALFETTYEFPFFYQDQTYVFHSSMSWSSGTPDGFGSPSVVRREGLYRTGLVLLQQAESEGAEQTICLFY